MALKAIKIRLPRVKVQPTTLEDPKVIEIPQLDLPNFAFNSNQSSVDPYYCQVILERWERFTGRKAVKV